MGGKASRTKGARWEREVARLFRDVFGDSVHRGLQSQGEVVPDVVTPYFWIECKVGKRPNVLRALRQACSAADDRVPLAVIKPDHSTPAVCMRLCDFIELLHSVPAFLEGTIANASK